MKAIRWMCGVKVTDRFTSSGFRERLGIDDVITVIHRHTLKLVSACFKKERVDTSAGMR